MKKYLLSLGMLLAVSVLVPFVTYAEATQNAHVHEMGQSFSKIRWFAQWMKCLSILTPIFYQKQVYLSDNWDSEI